MDFGKNNMHDFILAKEIIDELKLLVKEKKLQQIKKVKLEIGMISLAHDGHPEHTEDISIENLQFGLASITKNTEFEKIKFSIKKVTGDHWKITEVVV
jgi:Zn finger protein HypA/HybF involved in hydrogenase expression